MGVDKIYEEVFINSGKILLLQLLNQINSMTENDLLYTLALQHVPNIGDITAKRLISNCGSAEAVLKEKKQNLLVLDLWC